MLARYAPLHTCTIEEHLAHTTHKPWQLHPWSHLKKMGYLEPTHLFDTRDAHLWAAKAGTRGQTIPWKQMTPLVLLHVGLAASTLTSLSRRTVALKRLNSALSARGMPPLTPRSISLLGASKMEAQRIRSLCIAFCEELGKNSRVEAAYAKWWSQNLRIVAGKSEVLHNRVFNHRHGATTFDFQIACTTHRNESQNRTLGHDMAFIDQNLALTCPSQPKTLVKRWSSALSTWLTHAGFDSHAVHEHFDKVNVDQLPNQEIGSFVKQTLWFLLRGRMAFAWTSFKLLVFGFLSYFMEFCKFLHTHEQYVDFASSMANHIHTSAPPGRRRKPQ